MLPEGLGSAFGADPEPDPGISGRTIYFIAHFAEHLYICIYLYTLIYTYILLYILILLSLFLYVYIL